MYQDNFYKKVESDDFYKRNFKNHFNYKNLNKKNLRNSKLEIYKILKDNFKLSKKIKVLEIGCFIGDLLNYLKLKHKCKVFGIEPSSKACNFAKKKYGLKIENKTFINSKYFNLSIKNYNSFDVIICDDVLSWFDRDIIMSSLGVIDWLLKKKGIIFFRDFEPKKNFSHPNHHWRKNKIYNFKIKDGHKSFFLNSGKYKKIYHKKYFSKKMQKIKIKNLESMIWGDTILQKVKTFTNPIIKI